MKNRKSDISSKSEVRKLKGFSTMDMLIAIAIVGILVLIALPKQASTISKAKAVEAQMQLQHLYTLQKSYYYIHSKYTHDFEEVGFEQEKLTTEGGSANYRIEILEAGPGVFRASATSVVDFDNDGIFNSWEVDQEKSIREIIKD